MIICLIDNKTHFQQLHRTMHSKPPSTAGRILKAVCGSRFTAKISNKKTARRAVLGLDRSLSEECAERHMLRSIRTLPRQLKTVEKKIEILMKARFAH